MAPPKRNPAAEDFSDDSEPIEPPPPPTQREQELQAQLDAALAKLDKVENSQSSRSTKLPGTAAVHADLRAIQKRIDGHQANIDRLKEAGKSTDIEQSLKEFHEGELDHFVQTYKIYIPNVDLALNPPKKAPKPKTTETTETIETAETTARPTKKTKTAKSRESKKLQGEIGEIQSELNEQGKRPVAIESPPADLSTGAQLTGAPPPLKKARRPAVQSSK